MDIVLALAYLIAAGPRVAIFYLFLPFALPYSMSSRLRLGDPDLQRVFIDTVLSCVHV